MFKMKYRVVPDCYSGFEVQIKRWWLPFWYQANGSNTHSSEERAIAWFKAKYTPKVYTA